MQMGMTRALGWRKYQNPNDEHLYTIPQITLRQLAQEIASKLDRPILQVVGDPQMQVTGIALDPSYPGFAEQAGMEDCAQWLKTFIREVPVEFLVTRQPFWTTRTRRDKP